MEHKNSNRSHRAGHSRRNNNAKEDGFDNKITLKSLSTSFLRHKGFILTTIFACMAAALVWSYYATRIYQSSGSIMINESPQENSLKGSELTNMLNKTYGIGLNSSVSNELQFLQSRQVSLHMADELLKHPHMKNNEIFPVVWKDYPDDSTLVSRDTIATRIRHNINFSQVERDADLIEVAYQSPSPQEAAQMVDLAMNTYVEVSTHKNRTTAGSAVDFLEKERERLKDKLDSSEEQLRSFMNSHNIVQVDAQTQQLINRLSQLESERQTAKTNLVAVNSAIKEYETRLDNIKPGLSEQFSEASGPLLDRYQYQLAELQTQKTLILSQNPQLVDSKNPPANLRKLNEQINYIKGKIGDMTDKLTDKNGDYLSFLSNSGNASQNINDIQQKLIDLRTQKSQYDAKVKVLNDKLSQENKFFNSLPNNMIDLAKMKRDRQINEQMYQRVSEQYNQMVLWQKTQFSPGHIIDSGYIPENPIKPNTKLYLLVSIFLGGVLSIGFLSLRNAVNTKVNSIKLLKDRGYPVLAIIPLLEKATKKKLAKSKVEVLSRNLSTRLISVFDPISPGAEAFRRMNYNMVYSDPDKDSCNTILLTSSTNSEGKTTSVCNLGVVLTEAKKKVIIIDTDLGRPNVHNMFGMSRSPGLVDVIRGEIKLENAIQRSVITNLDILTSGSQASNPASINQNPQFEYLLQHLKMHYDYILIDTAPYGIFTDIAPIIKIVDGVVVVTRFKRTQEVELDHTVENLEKIKANILGFIITAFDHTKSNDYYNSSAYYDSTYKNYYSHTDDV